MKGNTDLTLPPASPRQIPTTSSLILSDLKHLLSSGDLKRRKITEIMSPIICLSLTLEYMDIESIIHVHRFCSNLTIGKTIPLEFLPWHKRWEREQGGRTTIEKWKIFHQLIFLDLDLSKHLLPKAVPFPFLGRFVLFFCQAIQMLQRMVNSPAGQLQQFTSQALRMR